MGCALSIDGNWKAACILKRVHFGMQEGVSKLYSPIVAPANNSIIMSNNGADWYTPFFISNSCFLKCNP